MKDYNPDHNLDDLIVPELENSKYKNLLTILALLIILIFVAISFVNTLIDNNEYKDTIENNHTTSADTPKDTNNSTINTEIDTEIKNKISKIKESINKDKNSSLDKIFDDEELDDKMPSPTDDIKDTVKIDDGYDMKPVTTTIPKESIKSIQKSIQDVTKEVVKDIPADNIIKRNTQEDIDKEIKRSKIKKDKIVKHKIKIKKSKPKETTHKPKHHTTTKSNKGSYYVQVGSFRNYPSKRFLSVIKNSGFEYIVTKPNSNGIRRLLIGGYPSRAVANGALKRVKDRINKHSYIIKR